MQIHWNIKYSDGSYDTVQKCWMVLVVHGELVTRIVAMEWLNALELSEHTANVCVRNNKARFKTMSHSWKCQWHHYPRWTDRWVVAAKNSTW